MGICGDEHGFVGVLRPVSVSVEASGGLLDAAFRGNCDSLCDYGGNHLVCEADAAVGGAVFVHCGHVFLPVLSVHLRLCRDAVWGCGLLCGVGDHHPADCA